MGTIRSTSASLPVILAEALFSLTQQRVLGLLFGQPERSFFASEVFRLVGCGRGTVQRELERLVACGLVTLTPIGNQKHYQANRDSLLFEELRGIVRKILGGAEKGRGVVAAKPGRREVRGGARVARQKKSRTAQRPHVTRAKSSGSVRKAEEHSWAVWK